jgi:hypothetical protein
MQSLISACKKSIYFKTAYIGPMLPLCLRVPKGDFLFCVMLFSVLTNVRKAKDCAVSIYNRKDPLNKPVRSYKATYLIPHSSEMCRCWPAVWLEVAQKVHVNSSIFMHKVNGRWWGCVRQHILPQKIFNRFRLNLALIYAKCWANFFWFALVYSNPTLYEIDIL